MRKILPILCLLTFLWSCAQEESWTTSPARKLVFSQDTVAFDTLISTIASTTKTLMVYNPGQEGLRISQIRVGEGEKSIFRLNVDGEILVGGTGRDFEVRHGDSIVVRIEATPPHVGRDMPRQFTDDLIFRLESGVEQKVHLSVGAQDAQFLQGLVVEHDTTFASTQPYVIYDSLVVAQNAVLTLAPGTRLMFHDQVSLTVRGSLHAMGTIEQPVVFRGDRTDHMFDYLLYDNTPNRWGGIHLCGSSSDNRFYNCDIHSGDYGILCDSTSLDKELLYVENSVLHNIGGTGLELNNCMARFLNTQISNTLGYTVYIFGGGYEFTHCTLAQFYPFDAGYGEALFLCNQSGENYRPLEYARFYNSVITGYDEDVIMGNISEGDELCDYLFDHCYLRTVASDDTMRFAQVFYDDKEQPLQGEKNFRLFDTENYLYDFTPDSVSRIRDMADPRHTDSEFDRLGRSRFMDDAPDAGCYEYVAP